MLTYDNQHIKVEGVELPGSMYQERRQVTDNLPSPPQINGYPNGRGQTRDDGSQRSQIEREVSIIKGDLSNLNKELANKMRNIHNINHRPTESYASVAKSDVAMLP